MVSTVVAVGHGPQVTKRRAGRHYGPSGRPAHHHVVLQSPRTPALPQVPAAVRPQLVAPLVESWGFVANPDLPDRPGPAYLLIALRPRPTLEHYDPERVDYWVSDEDGRGLRDSLTRRSPMPVDRPMSWGLIRLSDRLGATNEYLTFGGSIVADEIGDTTIAVITSPAPLLRRGGHSQPWDDGADTVGAFHGRLLLAVDVIEGFEQRLAGAEPLARYAAFVQDTRARAMRVLRRTGEEVAFGRHARVEAARLVATEPHAWAEGRALLVAGGMA